MFGAIFTSAFVVEFSALRAVGPGRTVTHRAALVAEGLAGLVCAFGAGTTIGDPLRLGVIAAAFLSFAISRIYFLFVE